MSDRGKWRGRVDPEPSKAVEGLVVPASQVAYVRWRTASAEVDTWSFTSPAACWPCSTCWVASLPVSTVCSTDCWAVLLTSWAASVAVLLTSWTACWPCSLSPPPAAGRSRSPCPSKAGRRRRPSEPAHLFLQLDLGQLDLLAQKRADLAGHEEGAGTAASQVAYVLHGAVEALLLEPPGRVADLVGQLRAMSAAGPAPSARPSVRAQTCWLTPRRLPAAARSATTPAAAGRSGPSRPAGAPAPTPSW